MGDKQKGFEFSAKKFWVPAFIFVVAVVLFYKTIDTLPGIFSGIGWLIGILTPFFIALVISLILYKPTDNLEKIFKKRKNNFVSRHALGLAVLISYIAFLLIIGAIMYIIIPKIVISIGSLVSNIPKYYTSVMDFISNKADSEGKIFGFDVSNLSSKITLESVLSYFNFETLAKYVSGISKATGVIVNISLAFVVSIYMLLGRRHLVNTAGKILGLVIPRRRIKTFYRFLSRSCDIFCSYLYSQFIDAVIVTIICLVVFSVARIPYALLLAVVMGICNLIPYFGAIIGGFSVVSVTLISTGSIIHAIVALACVVGAQQLDANVLQPKIVSQSVGLRPIYVLFAITVGNGLFGFLGILLGVPAMAVIRMIIIDYIESLDGEQTLLVKKQSEQIYKKDLKKASTVNNPPDSDE